MKQITEEQLLERKNPAVIDWAKEHNAITIQEFGNTDFFKETKKNTLDILQAQDKIPFVRFRGNYVYNFWQDANHNRGLIRRTTLEEYVKHEPTWEDVLDIDALAKDENKPWVYKGMTWLCPTYDRALVHLSDGGGDTVEIREFDIIRKSFINNGIYLPPAKSEVVWIHQDLLLIGTDVGEDALTNAGYPRTVRLMRRGQALAEAPIIFEGNKTDVAVDILSAVRPEGTIFCIQRAIDFFNCQYFIWNPEDPFCVTQVMVPTYVALEDIFQGELILRPREDWFINNQVYKAGSILSMHPFDPATIEIIYTAKDRTKVDSVSALKSKLVLKITDKNLT